MQDFLRALTLLTTLPVRARWMDDTLPGRAMAAYPLAGLLIGALLAVLAAILSRSIPPGQAVLLPAAIVLVAWAGLTGALHLDGWADCCDALFVPTSRERRLEILKDPRLGSFGGVGLVLLLLLKLAALQGVMARPGALVVLLAVPAVARWALVVAAAGYPPARPDGMAVHFRRGLGRREIALATLTALLASALPALTGAVPPLSWVALPLVAAVVMWCVARLAVVRLGGLTGDVYGAVVELVETGCLVAVCLWM
jgi:adenosylcobinamide-GDP ribazoletransferase